MTEEQEQQAVILATITYLRETIVERESQITELAQQIEEAQSHIASLLRLLPREARMNQLFQ